MLPEHEKEIVTKGLVLHRTTEGLYAYQIEKQVGNVVHLDHAKNNSFKIIRIRLANPHILAHTSILPATAPTELPINSTDTPLFAKTKNMKTLSDLLSLLSKEEYKPLFIPIKKVHKNVSHFDASSMQDDDPSQPSPSDYGVDAGNVYQENALQVMYLKKRLEEITNRKIRLI
jgi:hypothetical protein